jgi:hypothetical protein
MGTYCKVSELAANNSYFIEAMSHHNVLASSIRLDVRHVTLSKNLQHRWPMASFIALALAWGWIESWASYQRFQ